ncbi:hypothetical protein ACFQ0X_22255 [Streptomyces rectiviolaceus]|uniref:Secreted protein n=1 Tax=Streptomyces rectiviolaceus TaxID=332591 RepID=A0ABP6M6C0_9ACTN
MAAVLLGTALSPAAQAAPAAPGDSVTCAGGVSSTSIKPGLGIGDRQQSVYTEATTTGCHGSDIVAATLSVDGQGKGSCVPNLGIPNGEAQGRVRWTTTSGQESTSTLQGTFKFTITGWTLAGVVTEGTFKGQRVSASTSNDIASNTDAMAACFLGGFTNASGTLDQLAVAEA